MKFSLIVLSSLSFVAAKKGKKGKVCDDYVPYVSPFVEQLMYNAGVDTDLDNLHTIGAHTALIPEASDASVSGANVADGESGDTDFPHGNLKPLATVGEVSSCKDSSGEMIVGVPDGLGAYLKDNKTVRVVVQSESYGPLRYESYPFPVNDGTATFGGSHVQYVDYHRKKLSDFMNHEGPASEMVTGMGEAIEHAYNLKGELVGPRNPDGPTTVGAHFSNTDADGNYVAAAPISNGADWFMQSLCSAHLEEKHQWGPGIGFEDDIFLTNEEWMTYEADVEAFVGLSAHAIDLSTKTDYALGSVTNGGFEKIVEVNPLHKDYVIIAISGYNGSFGDYDKVIEKRNNLYTRGDGNPYVKPQNIVPARIYIGKKGKMEDGSDAPASDFLARNGLRYGKMYGFAIDMSASGPTGGLWRDAFHKDASKAVNGAEVPGVFTPIAWQWDGDVKNFEHDGSWDFQDQPPMHVGSDNYFWNGKGNDSEGCKTEHNSPDPREGMSAFVQTSTCGYFGHYYLDGIADILDGLSGTDLPGDIPARYFVYQGELDITSQIELGGKGQYADGQSALTNCDSTSCSKTTFEDIDGFEVLEDNGTLYAIIQEDSGNDYGERMFITSPLKHNGSDLKYYFIAMSGGSDNTRMMAGVGIPAGVSGGASSHEFSGIADMSGLLKKKGNRWAVSAYDAGHAKRAADRSVSINDKVIVLGLQAHNYNSGVIEAFKGDRGGQWLAYNPNIPV